MADPFADLPDVRYRAPTVADPFADLPDKVFRVAPSRKPKSDNLLTGTIREMGQGATFGFADELKAALNATRRRLTGDAGDWSSAYDEELAKDRGRLHAFQEEHPLAAAGGNIAGGVVTPAMGAVGAAKSLVGAGLKAGGAGMAAGALSGFGSAEGGAGNRATGAALGGAAGGVLGAGAGMAIKGAGGLAGLVPLGGGAKRQGQALLRNAMENDNLPPAELADRIRRANAAGVEGLTIGDVATVGDAMSSGQVQGLAADALNHPSRLQGPYRGQIETRQAGKMTIKGPVGDQGTAVQMDVRKAAGLQRQRAYATAQQLKADRKAAADRLFTQARAVDLSGNPEVHAVWQQVIDTDAAEGAMNSARKVWANKHGRAPFPLDQRPADVPPMEVLQMFKEGLDGEVRKLWKAGDNEVAKSAGAIRDNFRDTLKKANPVYGEALKQYAGDTALEEALEKGQNFKKMPVDEMLDTLKNMTDGEAEQFRIGAVTAFFDNRKIGPTVDYTAPLLKERDDFTRIMALIPDDEAREQLLLQLTTRKQMSQLAGKGVGSRTSPLQEGARMVEGGAAPREIPLTPGGIARLIFDKTVGKARDVATQARRAEIAQTLMQQDSGALQALQKLNMGATGPETAAARAGVPLGAVAGSGAGRLFQQPDERGRR